MASIRELVGRLSGDAWRLTHAFSQDVLEANALLHNSAATDEEMAECMNLWCLGRQPCQFGRVAAKQGRIHFCFVRESALREWADDDIAEKIEEEKRLWKQRAAFEPERAAHSFVLVVASPTVAYASADRHLRAFSDRVLELAGWGAKRRGARRNNAVSGDYLYLREPNAEGLLGYRFNLDYFACAGDGRWWHDHRAPGGIAFTANSTGHMLAFRKMYLGQGDSREWGARQAMLTIASARGSEDSRGREGVGDGRATWLRPLDGNGEALVKGVECPFKRTPRILEGKDWTRYEGWLHTDHAVREEFFVERDRPPTANRPYLMDFTYLYDEGEEDFEVFTAGRRFPCDEVWAEIGRPEDWTHRRRGRGVSRAVEEASEVAVQLETCRRWSVERECPEGEE